MKTSVEKVIVSYHQVVMVYGKPVPQNAMTVLDIPQATTCISVLEQDRSRRIDTAQQIGNCLDEMTRRYPVPIERNKKCITMNTKNRQGIYTSTTPVPCRVATFLFFACCLKDDLLLTLVVRQLKMFVVGKDVGVISAAKRPDKVIA